MRTIAHCIDLATRTTEVLNGQRRDCHQIGGVKIFSCMSIFILCHFDMFSCFFCCTSLVSDHLHIIWRILPFCVVNNSKLLVHTHWLGSVHCSSCFQRW